MSSVVTAMAIIAATETMRPPSAYFEVGGVEPKIRPFALDRSVEKGIACSSMSLHSLETWLFEMPLRAISKTAAADEPHVLPRPCRCCGGRMIIIETFAAGCHPKHRPTPATTALSIDSS
jgi:hypothetical protein